MRCREERGSVFCKPLRHLTFENNCFVFACLKALDFFRVAFCSLYSDNYFISKSFVLSWIRVERPVAMPDEALDGRGHPQCVRWMKRAVLVGEERWKTNVVVT